MLKQILKQRIGIRSVFLGLSFACAVTAHAQTADFSGKRIDVIIPFGPGGGVDVYARALAPFLEKHLPGKPTIVLRHVPGGGSIPGANQFQARAKPDGLTAIVASASTVANFVFQRSKAQFDIEKWQPVLLSPQGAVFYVSPSLGLKGPQDLAKLKGQKLSFGGQGPTAGEARFVVAFELLGLSPNYVWGLTRGPVRLAYERGELNINYDAAPAFLTSGNELVKAGKAVPLFSLGILDSKGNVVRDPLFPDLPNFPEAFETMHGKKPSGPGYDAWKALLLMGVMANKLVFLPEGTPKHIVEAWRTAVRNLLKDPEFDKVASSVVEGYPQVIGEDMRPIIRDATTLSPAVWEWLREFYKTKHNATL